MTKWLQTVFLVLIMLGLSAQSTQVILLKNHNLYLDNSLTEGLKPLPIEQNQPSYYRLVQFSSVDHVKLWDKTADYEVLEYLPKNAYLIRVFNNGKDIVELLRSKGAVTASTMNPSWKLSKKLFQENIPEWAYTDNNFARIWLRYYDGMNHQTVVNSISRSFNVSNANPDENLIEVTISPDKVMDLAALPYIYYVQEMEDPGSPENYTARTDHRVNSLQSSFPGAPSYDGSGIVVGHGDDGRIGPHIDYTGRMTQPLATASTGDHGDHVAGIIFGAGNLDPTGRGMAPGAEIFYQTYPDNLSTADFNYSNRNVRVTVSSYSNGCNAGYTNFTRQMDQDAIDNPDLVHVFSAGNSGTSNCGYGAGSVWGNVTGGHKIAKNVIAVANLTNIDGLASSSSRGPASDGRIKPDVSAVGTSVYSTTNPDAYTFKTGTSMSCPGVGGVVSVLYEAYQDVNQNTDPKAGLLKAILMNTCDDLGNPGPDFRFGYGRVNTRRAYEVIKTQNHITDNITNGATKSFQIQVPSNTAEARIMLYWPDVPASTIAAQALVNDLDMEVSQNGTAYKPWILDPTPNTAALSSNAVRGVDTLNNIEQVTFKNPGSGDITVTVDGTNIPQNSQEFYIIYEFVPNEVVVTYPMGGEGFVPGEDELIRWDSPEVTSNFTIESSNDGGTTWNTLSTNVPSTRRYYSWAVPNIPGGDFKIRVTNGTMVSESPGTFTVAGTPNNLQVASVCPDSIQLTWDPVNSATAYVVYKLGAKYMDSTVTTAAAFAKVANNNQAEWYSVAAITANNGLGRRAIAIKYVPNGVFNCSLDNDLDVAQLLSPAPGFLPDCFNFTNVPVSVRLKNNGKNPIYNFDVSYKLNNGTTITENVTDTIPVNGTLDHTFSGSSVSLTIGSNYNMSVWVNYIIDDNNFNDSIAEDIALYAGTSVSFPYSHDFESFSNCATANDCGATICNLVDGWVNSDNGTRDDIDFRTNNGGTPSGSTGPSSDHNPGTTAGKYVYLEASNGCDSSLAQLLSPCIDLSTANSPLLEFWYHMSGTNMGVLSVDIFDGTEWNLNVTRIAGNQGNSWRSRTLNLLPYVGKTIMVRFNGKTGDGFAADLSLDDFNVFENTTSPTTSFGRSTGLTCIDGVINFTDQSANIPTSWEWIIQPNTFSFVNGTDSSSQNVSVQFHNIGTYAVSLVSTNAFGSDTLTQSQSIIVDPGTPIPVFEDFEGLFAPTGWSIENPDGLTQWKSQQVVGPYSSSTKAAAFDNFNSGASGENDGLITLNLDLRTAVNPILLFDVAYAPKSSSSNDSLIIDASTDCGFTYSTTSYQKGGATLQTASMSQTLFIPNNATQWRRDTLDLAPFIGNNVKLRFRNYSDGGNAVYLDNVQVVSSSVVAPIALFTTLDSLVCNGDDVIFNDASNGGPPDNYSWSFSSNAIPSTANTAGPHTVRFVNNGSFTVTLTISNNGGFSQHSYNVYVEETPLAVFDETFQTVQTIQFNDLSAFDPTSWAWDFGDGNTSIQQNPNHTYATDGTYDVDLIVTNRCGTSTRTRQVIVQGIGITEQIDLTDLSIFPNPSKGEYNLNFGSDIPQDIQIDVLDLNGKKVRNFEFKASTGQNELKFDLSNLSKGIYLLKLSTESGSHTLRAIKE